MPLAQVGGLLRHADHTTSLAVRGARLVELGARALAGDANAAAQLRTEGVHEAIDIIVPGGGEMTRRMRARIGEFTGAQVESGVLPWLRFQRWLLAQRWGSFVVLGPKGTAKTTFAFRLAQLWADETGWPVDAVNVYQGDVPSWAKKRQSRWFLGLIGTLLDYLDPEDDEEEDEDDASAKRSRSELRRAKAAFKSKADLTETEFVGLFSQRIIVIDEMSAFVPPHGLKRDLVRRIVNQLRHMGWIVIFIGQIAKHVPEDMLNCEALFFKEPLGDEYRTDRDNTLIEDLWLQAGACFGALQRSPWRDLDDGQFADLRSWVYCYSRSFPGGYAGPMPFRREVSVDGRVPLTIEAAG